MQHNFRFIASPSKYFNEMKTSDQPQELLEVLLASDRTTIHLFIYMYECSVILFISAIGTHTFSRSFFLFHSCFWHTKRSNTTGSGMKKKKTKPNKRTLLRFSNHYFYPKYCRNFFGTPLRSLTRNTDNRSMLRFV